MGEGGDLIGGEDGVLSEDVREGPAEEHEGRLAAGVDGGHVGLDEGDPAGRVDARDQHVGVGVGEWAEASGVAGAGGDVRLDDDLFVERWPGVSGDEEEGGDGGDRQGGEVAACRPLGNGRWRRGAGRRGGRHAIPGRAEHVTNATLTLQRPVPPDRGAAEHPPETRRPGP